MMAMSTYVKGVISASSLIQGYNHKIRPAATAPSPPRIGAAANVAIAATPLRVDVDAAVAAAVDAEPVEDMDPAADEADCELAYDKLMPVPFVHALPRVLLLPLTKLTGAHCEVRYCSKTKACTTYLIQRAIDALVNDLNHTCFPSERAWRAEIVGTEDSHTIGVDHLKLREVVWRCSVCSSHEGE